MKINLDQDTVTISIFFIFAIIFILLFAIINSSYKNTDNDDSSTPDWGSELLVILLIMGFIKVIYTYNNVYIFIGGIFFLIILIM